MKETYAKMQDGRKVAIYARQSQEKEGSISCETQIDICSNQLTEIEKKNVAWYKDEGYTGSNTNRPDFKRLMSDVLNDKINKVIVYKLDRIGRNLRDFVDILDEFKEHGVTFISAEEAFETNTPFGKMIVQMLMVFAEFERSTTVERVRDAYASRAEQGIYMGGRVPYGFMLVPTVVRGINTKMLTPKQDEIAVVTKIFDMYSEDQASLRTVLKYLVENKCPSKYGWSTAKLSTILRNPLYVRTDMNVYEFYRKLGVDVSKVNLDTLDEGYALKVYGRTYQGGTVQYKEMKVVTTLHKGFIDPEIWLKCQKRLGFNNQIGRCATSRNTWLSGLLHCNECGHVYTTKRGAPKKDGTRVTYLVCDGRVNKLNCKGSSKTMYLDEVENFVSERISEKILTLKNERPVLSKENQEKIELLKKEKDKIQEQQEGYLKLFISSEANKYTIKSLNEHMEKLGIRIEEIDREIDGIIESNSLLEKSLDIAALWNRSNFDRKRQVARLLIEVIFIHSDGSVEIVWKI